jgi:hypothetical protein
MSQIDSATVASSAQLRATLLDVVRSALPVGASIQWRLMGGGCEAYAILLPDGRSAYLTDGAGSLPYDLDGCTTVELSYYTADDEEDGVCFLEDVAGARLGQVAWFVAKWVQGSPRRELELLTWRQVCRIAADSLNKAVTLYSPQLLRA